MSILHNRESLNMIITVQGVGSSSAIDRKTSGSVTGGLPGKIPSRSQLHGLSPNTGALSVTHSTLVCGTL